MMAAKCELELNQLMTDLEAYIYAECANAQAQKTSPIDWQDNARAIARRAIRATRMILESDKIAESHKNAVTLEARRATIIRKENES
jgi:hypothetical protein